MLDVRTYARPSALSVLSNSWLASVIEKRKTKSDLDDNIGKEILKKRERNEEKSNSYYSSCDNNCNSSNSDDNDNGNDNGNDDNDSTSNNDDDHNNDNNNNDNSNNNNDNNDNINVYYLVKKFSPSQSPWTANILFDEMGDAKITG